MKHRTKDYKHTIQFWLQSNNGKWVKTQFVDGTEKGEKTRKTYLMRIYEIT